MNNDWDAFIDSRRVAAPSTRAPELLFEFVRASDRAPMAMWLKFRGESYGWEAQIFERGELFMSHGGFTMRAAADAWDEAERKAME
jgi:hypothetical protein